MAMVKVNVSIQTILVENAEVLLSTAKTFASSKPQSIIQKRHFVIVGLAMAGYFLTTMVIFVNISRNFK